MDEVVDNNLFTGIKVFIMLDIGAFNETLDEIREASRRYEV